MEILERTEKRCEYCDEVMEYKNKFKRFCCESHKRKFNYKSSPIIREALKERSRNYYNKVKNNPEFRQKSRERVKKWISLNRERWNASMRKVMKRRNAKINIKKNILKLK